MRKVAYFIFVAAGTVTTWVASRSVVAQAFIPDAMTITYSQTTGDGVTMPTKTLIAELSIRSNGSTSEVRHIQAPDGRSYEQKVILDVGTQREVVVDSITESVTTYALSVEGLKSLTNAGARCATFANAKQEAHLGHRVLTITQMFSDRSIESSFAPDVGCVLMRQVISQKGMDGQYRIVSRKEATALRLGEPNPARFQVPAWKERSPSAVIAEFERKFQLKSSNTEAHLQKDKAYYARQVK